MPSTKAPISGSMAKQKKPVVVVFELCGKFAISTSSFIKTGMDAKEWRNKLHISIWNARLPEKEK